MGMLADGTAYTLTTAPDGTSWLEASAALTGLCPPVPTFARMACLTRVDSTIKGGVLSRHPTVAALRPDDPTSLAEVCFSHLMLLCGFPPALGEPH